jgi:epoxyqueuosine reductase
MLGELLTQIARSRMSKCPGYDAAFTKARNHPELIPVAKTRKEASDEEFTAAVNEFALSHEADACRWIRFTCSGKLF